MASRLLRSSPFLYDYRDTFTLLLEFPSALPIPPYPLVHVPCLRDEWLLSNPHIQGMQLFLVEASLLQDIYLACRVPYLLAAFSKLKFSWRCCDGKWSMEMPGWLDIFSGFFFLFSIFFLFNSQLLN